MGTTNSSGTLINSYKYDSFGNIESYIGEITNTRLFSGREYDFDTGLYYNRARYYSPEMGRFIGRDPIDVGDDVNLYRYCGNNGVRFVDPMGMEKNLIEAHDATELLKAYMKEGREETSLLKLIRKSAFSTSKYNIKYREDFKKIAFTPDEDRESCDVYKDGAGHCLVYIDGEKTVELSELGNFLIGYNFYHAGFTLDNKKGSFYNDIYSAGVLVEKENRKYYDYKNFFKKNEIEKDALKDELQDRPWYSGGYNYARNGKNWLKRNDMKLSNYMPNK